MKCTSIGVALAAALSALSAAAENFYVKNGATDWTTADSFTMDAEGTTPATRAPGDGEALADAVFIPGGYVAYVGDTNSLARVNNLDRIRPMNGSAKLVISVPEGKHWTNSCPFNYDGVNRSTYQGYGKLCKRGAGTLELTSAARYFNGTSYNTDYCSTLIAEEGTFLLPQDPPRSGVFYSHELAVSNGATLVTCMGVSTYPCLLSGAGTLTNRASTAQILFLVGASQNSTLPSPRSASSRGR